MQIYYTVIGINVEIFTYKVRREMFFKKEKNLV